MVFQFQSVISSRFFQHLFLPEVFARHHWSRLSPIILNTSYDHMDIIWQLNIYHIPGG